MVIAFDSPNLQKIKYIALFHMSLHLFMALDHVLLCIWAILANIFMLVEGIIIPNEL